MSTDFRLIERIEFIKRDSEAGKTWGNPHDIVGLCDLAIEALSTRPAAPSGNGEAVEWVKAGLNAALEAVRHCTAGNGRPFADAIEECSAERIVGQPAPSGDGWMPIETAPKDGTAVLIAQHNGEVWGQSVAWWIPEFEWETDYAADWPEDGERPGKYRGAWIDGGLDGGEEQIEYRPTHWMPLPPAPR